MDRDLCVCCVLCLLDGVGPHATPIDAHHPHPPHAIDATPRPKMISARTTDRGRPDARRGDERAAAPQLQRERRAVGREARLREEQARGLARARHLRGNQTPTPHAIDATG